MEYLWIIITGQLVSALLFIKVIIFRIGLDSAEMVGIFQPHLIKLYRNY